ncbi:MAG: flagellar hook-associated protein FlgL [Desulfobacteraceae bacterium]|nr:flagellar hook-associated protein FlgL [Desulfobacteraceae bacterium]
MRISNAMMANNIQGYLSKHTESLLNIQERIASGKRINRPSDDPVGMQKVLDYTKQVSGLDQYNNNITIAQNHVNSVDDILSAVTDLLSQAKKIAADTEPDMRATLADQVDILREQVVQLANSKDNGNYIFAGDLTDIQPFDPTTGVYSGDNGTKDYLIGDGLQINIQADGSQIFETGGTSVFDVLTDLSTQLRANNSAGITAQMPLLDDAVQTLNSTRAVNAGKYQLMDATSKHNSLFKVNVQDLLSKTQDTDIAAAAIDFSVEQTAYQSTLATAAKIVQPSLMDYLK